MPAFPSPRLNLLAKPTILFCKNPNSIHVITTLRIEVVTCPRKLYRLKVESSPTLNRSPSLGHAGLENSPVVDRFKAESLGVPINQVCESENSAVVAAVFQEQAAGDTVNVIRGKLLPQVDVEAKYEREHHPSRIVTDEETTSVVASVTVPFYQAGEVSSEVRQANQVQWQRLEQIRQARVQTRANVMLNWSQLISARAQLAADRVSAEANKVALRGVVKEQRQGKRTVLDVLNAQQAQLDSNMQIVVDKRNVVVASFNVLTAVGRLSPSFLGLPVELYDVEQNYHDVRDKLWGTRIEHEPNYDGYVEMAPD